MPGKFRVLCAYFGFKAWIWDALYKYTERDWLRNLSNSYFNNNKNNNARVTPNFGWEQMKKKTISILEVFKPGFFKIVTINAAEKLPF